MKQIEKMNQWYMLKDPSFEGKSTTSLGTKVLAYIITDYCCEIKSRTHILKVKQIYDGEVHCATINRHEPPNDADAALYKPVSDASIAAYLL